MPKKNTPLLMSSEALRENGGNDCACSDTLFSFKQDSLSSHRHYTLNYENVVFPLINGFRLLFSPHSPFGPSVANHIAWQRYQTFAKQAQPLSQAIDQQFAEQQLIVPHNKPINTHKNDKPNTMSVWLHISNACNLACPYCYVRKSSQQMQENIGINALHQLFTIAKQQGFNQLKLKYAGGEALLHFKLVKRLHEEAARLAKKHHIQLQEVVLSNGTVINQHIAQWLQENSVKLMLSIDGLHEVHDRLRPTKNHTSAFAALEKNLNRYLLPLGIKPDISITITALNAKTIGDVVAWVLERDLPFSINFYRENAQSLSRHELALEEDAIIHGLREAYQIIEKNLPERPVFNNLLDKVQSQAHTHTCGVGQNYFVVKHTGEFAQCQMQLDKPMTNTEKTVKAMHLLQDSVIKNVSVDDKSECNRCTFRYRCTAGCPLETYRTTQRWDVKSPHCRIYKTLYPEVLRLEGLRLLKQQGLLPH